MVCEDSEAAEEIGDGILGCHSKSQTTDSKSGNHSRDVVSGIVESHDDANTPNDRSHHFVQDRVYLFVHRVRLLHLRTQIVVHKGSDSTCDKPSDVDDDKERVNFGSPCGDDIRQSQMIDCEVAAKQNNGKHERLLKHIDKDIVEASLSLACQSFHEFSDEPECRFGNGKSTDQV